MGVMRMVSAIDVNWVAPLLPKLKDPVDIDRLNDPTKADIEESKYQDKMTSKGTGDKLGKRSRADHNNESQPSIEKLEE